MKNINKQQELDQRCHYHNCELCKWLVKDGKVDIRKEIKLLDLIELEDFNPNEITML